MVSHWAHLFFSLSLREWPRLPFTAHIGRARSHRARSASKKGTWPLPSPSPSSPISFQEGDLVNPQLRASNEHILIVRVPRARGRPGHPPPLLNLRPSADYPLFRGTTAPQRRSLSQAHSAAGRGLPGLRADCEPSYQVLALDALTVRCHRHAGRYGGHDLLRTLCPYARHKRHAHRRPGPPRLQRSDPAGCHETRSPLHQDLANCKRRYALSKDLCGPLGLSSSIL